MNDIAAIGSMCAALLAALVSLATYVQGRTIKKHTNGMLATMEKAAYDRGAADEKTGDAAPKAAAPETGKQQGE